MESVLAAEAAILVELQPIRVVLFVLERIVVPLLTFGASQCNLNAHGRASLFLCYLSAP